ncbi:AAA family ATPase [Acetobacter sacchari]|uniref:AAA family ATPase n=1 Tax=Acetobacter sacchari TaxID=2661687 RepID=A0ABS3LSQ9_9PROT|nr:AAA family ATPase [Acetobacter sacchari]MBO1358942.1 AAA family ATPase [Acetobacter sacchari]
MKEYKDVGPRGSEWRKWDLQVHTPASHLNNQFGSDWDVYVQNLFRMALTKGIAVIGLTDYFTIDGYKKVKEDYLANPAKLKALFSAEEIEQIAGMRVLPNIEFRLRTLVGPNRINCHVILSDEVAIRDIEENFLHDLTFTNQAKPQATAETHKLKVENLRQFGERLIKEHPPFGEQGDALFVGMTNAVVDDNHILQALQDSRFKDKFLFCVVADEDLPKLKWDSQDHHTRKLLIQRSDALFAGNPATRNWALAREPQYTDGEEHFLREFKTLKPCVHGSDCHGYPEIGHPCAKRGKKGHDCAAVPAECELRYCWIKADTTFEGLRQILHEPADRVYIGASPPVYYDEARVISRVTLSDGKGWFSDVSIPLNAGMVSIIGQKGSGKSALADLIAFAAGSWDPAEKDCFLKRSSGHLDGMKVTLHWADGHTSEGIVGRDRRPTNEVHYLSQNYVERICAKDGITKELVREIEKVVFHYLDPTDTLNASDFEELRLIKTEGVREEGNRLRDEMYAVIRDECALRDLIAKTPEKQARVKTLTEEREGLLKQLPAPASEAEAKVQEELQQKRQELTKAQQGVAAHKQNLQRIADIRTRTGAFGVQMERFFEQLQPTLREVGVPEGEWKKFRPDFPAEIEPPLAAREKAVNEAIAVVEGGEPPAAGTIRKLLAEIDELMKRETADKARQERTKQIQNRVAVINTEVERLNAEIKNVEENGSAQIATFGTKRLDAYVAYFANLKLEQQALQGLYDPIRERLTKQALLKGRELEFAIRWAADVSTWIERGAALFDQRRAVPYGSVEQLGKAANRILLPAWASGDPERIRTAFEIFMGEFRKKELPWKSYVRNGVTLQDVLNWLYEVSHIRLEYGLKFNGAELESLSPGTKGIVLLILYLGMDIEDSRPLVVDQPDENLDNESIYNLLTPYFRLAKVRRQIIVITHNPNLVVNSDSEQVIVATGEKQENGLPIISYNSGSLEENHPPETGMRQQVCNILEGGDVAFLKRERRYAIREK